MIQRPTEKMIEISKRVNAIIPKLLLQLLKMQADNIRARSLDGVDLQGDYFAPYNEKYEKWKMRNAGHLDWLRLTGEMMRSYVERLKNTNTGDLKIGSGAVHSSKQMNDLAGWHNFGTKTIPARSFWGFTESDIIDLHKYGAKVISKAVHNAT